MYVLLVTDFFVEPYFGILGILVFGVARGRRLDLPVRRTAPTRRGRC